MMRSCTTASTTGAGEYAPIPPVFGPVSPSPAALWSWEDASATASPPPTAQMKLASSPARNSSTTILRPASPNARPESISPAAASASSSECATTTPLPAARPSALTTIGAPCPRMWEAAASMEVNPA